MKQSKRVFAISMIVVMLLAMFSPVMSRVEAATVKLNTKSVTLTVGSTKQLKLVGTKKTVKWSSSNKKVATVSKKGKVTAKKAGKATITAKVSGKKYTCKITVKKAKVQLNKTTAYVSEGKKIKLKVNNYSGAVTWTSADSSIASVTKSGYVKGKKKGTTVIQATIKSGKVYTCKVTVETPSYDKKWVQVKPGSTVQFKITGTKQKITWSMENAWEDDVKEGHTAERYCTLNKKTGKVKVVRTRGGGSATIRVIAKLEDGSQYEFYIFDNNEDRWVDYVDYEETIQRQFKALEKKLEGSGKKVRCEFIPDNAPQLWDEGKLPYTYSWGNFYQSYYEDGYSDGYLLFHNWYAYGGPETLEEFLEKGGTINPLYYEHIEEWKDEDPDFVEELYEDGWRDYADWEAYALIDPDHDTFIFRMGWTSGAAICGMSQEEYCEHNKNLNRVDGYLFTEGKWDYCVTGAREAIYLHSYGME